MEALLKPLKEIEEYNQIIGLLENNEEPVLITGLFESQKSHMAAGIIYELDRACAFVTFNELNAKKIYEDLSLLLGDRVVYYPSRELVLFNIEAEGMPITARRVSAIQKILSDRKSIVVLSVDALLNRLIPKDFFFKYIRNISLGQTYNLNELVEFLAQGGYKRVDIVEGRGQYSIRGGILDIFPVNYDNAVRIDFFDDEVDSIRVFDVSSQRSLENISEAAIMPARELIFDKEVAKKAVEGIKEDLENLRQHPGTRFNELEKRVHQDIEKIENGIYFPGIEKYISYFYKDAVNLLGYFENSSLVFIDEYSKLEQAVKINYDQFSENIKDMLERGSILPKVSQSILNFDDIMESLKSMTEVYLSTFPHSIYGSKLKNTFNIPSKPVPSFNGRMDVLIEDIKDWKAKNKRIAVLAGTEARAEKFKDFLHDNSVISSFNKGFTKVPKPGEIIITVGSLNRGFEYSSIDLIVISDKEIFGEEKKRAKRRKKLGQRINTFAELSPMDYVVHQSHGIGQFVGIESLKVEGVIKDYLKIKYVQGDLFVPVSQLELVQKYIGSEGKAPKINKLGGADWNKVKARVRESVQNIAKELIRLYAERQTLKGFEFPKDNVWQRQFEETFPYEETDDQLRCIEEAKGDMESPKPMDRLLCGDVGYGKTEVAMRAAFKAVLGNKQVAYLCPTTILAQQHYKNFTQRMKDFPVRIEMLSRFKTPKEQKEIIKNLKDGIVDIVIGTHKLLQKDVSFKELGLVIVDEEQRFGVSHKEKLKTLTKNVDVLTLTATPIPRTLHMALVGVRDMSVIEEPPEERHPVQTYVMEHDYEMVREAIVREVGRGGQVFYLYNRVASIHKVAAEIQALVPEARVVFAHGQMSENELEDIIAEFLNGEYDVLVCTTIIETGVDMPNVNTIIIEDADKMGLSQLYQLRGRVGRASRQAYAYLTFRKDKVLSEEADKRLKAIKEFTEFGSGFKIAMRDLEIRGAGNLLGAEQHGHMNLVGYDMYCKILENAVKELRGEEVKETVETLIDVNISAYIHDNYINNHNQKILMYKKIAAIESEEDILEVREELIDRFGDIPEETENLIQIAYIKSICKELNILSLVQKDKNIVITFAYHDAIDVKIIGELSSLYKKQILFSVSNTPYLTYKPDEVSNEKLLENIKILLQSIKKLKQG